MQVYILIHIGELYKIRMLLNLAFADSYDCFASNSGSKLFPLRVTLKKDEANRNRGNKTFFMLSSAEHEISNAHK